ncbi:MAG: 6-carboxytetrahydropterin synthase QueD [Candidatus Omnitrophica bacterium]|nr:6-carboxytetrahydropterin synthase QueD [Candidatus Omnitrophota bacterium]
MYEIKVTDEFSGAHNLRNYKGKCEALHGHNWKIEVSVCSDTLDKNGMIMDFKELKNKLTGVLDGLDHKYLNDLSYFKKKNPTSENIAAFIHRKLSERLSYSGSCAGGSASRKISVSVWETSASCASYEN